MHAISCPTCGTRCLSPKDKLKLGPGRTVTCASCGAKYSVAWATSILYLVLEAVVPLLAGFCALVLVGSFGSLWALLLVFLLGALLGAAPLLWAYVRFVPLVRRGA